MALPESEALEFRHRPRGRTIAQKIATGCEQDAAKGESHRPRPFPLRRFCHGLHVLASRQIGHGAQRERQVGGGVKPLFRPLFQTAADDGVECGRQRQAA